MRIRVLIGIVVVIFFILPLAMHAEHDRSFGELNDLSDHALRLTKQERFGEAKQLLEHFSDEFVKVSIQNRQFSMDELRIITMSHKSALEAVTSSSLALEERIRRVTQFRLAIDAVHSENQPLWAEMEPSVMASFKELKQTALESEAEGYQTRLQNFLEKYEMLLPSVRVDVKPEYVQRMEAHINFLTEMDAEEVDGKNKKNQLELMEKDLKELFNKLNRDETDPSLLWVMITTGSIIILTLSYVGWKKYRGDKNKRVSSQRDNEK